MRAVVCVLVCVLLVGCEKTVDDPDWPEYVEKGILHAELVFTQDSLGVYCNLSRTAPLGQQFDYLGTRIKDARISFVRENEQHGLPGIQWDLERGDYYNYALHLPFRPAREYSIHAEWEGKRLEGRLSINTDVSTTADSILITKDPNNPERYIATFRLFALPDLIYDLNVYGNTSVVLYGFPVQHIPPEGKMIQARVQLRQGRCTYVINAFSRRYRDWSSPEVSSDPFDARTGNPKHNVSGDGIGFFTYQFHGQYHSFDVQ